MDICVCLCVCVYIYIYIYIQTYVSIFLRIIYGLHEIFYEIKG